MKSCIYFSRLIASVILVVLMGICLNRSAVADSSKVQIIAAPWASANSDEGVVFGATAGLAKPDMVIFPSAYIATLGSVGFGVKGEISTNDWIWLGESTISKSIKYLYPDGSGIPDYDAKATVNRFFTTLSVLKPFDNGWEVGPDILIDMTQSKEVKNADGQPSDKSNYPRFGDGSIYQLGIKARWRTTSAIRPKNGWIVELALRGGRAAGDEIVGVKPDLANDLRVAYVTAFTDRSRIYLRSWWRYQLNAPAPVQNDLGWVRSLRGQPIHRDYGRKIICSRIQYHYLITDSWGWPLEVAHSIFSLFPVAKLEVEWVGFYDMGITGDPSFGWTTPRHGLGMGFRFALPPELVVFIDFAISPGADWRYYTGTGETI